MHLVLERTGPSRPQTVAVVLKPEREAKTTDPEQRIVAPIFNSPQKLIYEFTAAEIVFASTDGTVEVREVTLDPLTGHVGTRTVYSFHGKFAKLAARCAAHLQGATDLYPAAPPRRPRAIVNVPAGMPNLSFDPDGDRCSVGPMIKAAKRFRCERPQIDADGTQPPDDADGRG